MEKFNGSRVRTDIMGDGERRSGSEVLALSRGSVAIFGGTSREAAGGGRGGKLDSGKGSGGTDGLVEDEGVRADDIAGRGAWVCPRLDLDMGAGMMAGTGDNVAEHFRMTGPGLPLSSALEVAAPGDEEDNDNHAQDQRDSVRDARPVHVNEANPVI